MKRLLWLVPPVVGIACTIMNDRHLPATNGAPPSMTPPPGTASGKTCDDTKPFERFEALVELTTNDDEQAPRLLPDELTIYFQRTNLATTTTKAFVAHRAKREDKFGTPEEILTTVTNPLYPAPTPDGKRLYFLMRPAGEKASLRTAEKGSSGAFPTFTPVADAGPGDGFGAPTIRDTEIYFARGLDGANTDIFSAAITASGALAAPGVVVPGLVYDDFNESDAVLSADGKTIYFYSDDPNGTEARIYVARRASVSDAFGASTAVEEIVQPNGGCVAPGTLSTDKCRLYYYQTPQTGAPAHLYVAIRE